MDPDEELVRRAKKGDRFAFERLVAEHEQRMYTLAARVLGSREDAADAVQEALVRAWLALPRFREEARFSTWLYRIVVNTSHDLRPKRREAPTDAEVVAISVSAAAVTSTASA